ncbi:MAG: TraR/DksA family transcriptional regulator [Dermatophilaceae bacterium]
MGDGSGVTPAARLAADRAALRARLVAMERDMERLHAASRDSNADDEHDPEGQTIAYERSQLAALIAGARRRLAELEAAATRLDEGAWGRCEVCAEPIPHERLEARPTARTCVRCAEPAARRGR